MFFWLGNGIERKKDCQSVNSFAGALHFSITTFSTLGSNSYKVKSMQKVKDKSYESYLFLNSHSGIPISKRLYMRCRVSWQSYEWFKGLVAVEAITGAILIALLLIVFGRTFMR